MIAPVIKPELMQAAHDMKKLVYLGNFSLMGLAREPEPEPEPEQKRSSGHGFSGRGCC